MYRTQIKFMLVLTALLLFSGSVIGWAAHHEKGKTTAAEVKEEVSETYATLKQYTAEQRREAMAAAEKKLAKLDANIEEMQDSIDQK